MSERLYLDDSYLIEFEAVVTDKITLKGKTGLIVDKTCFYPVSGGQLCDKGWINEIEVTEVFERDDKIVHMTESDINDKKIKGVIDWNYRFENMQLHTGQHILSQSFIRLFDAFTISSTLGSTACTVDICKKELSEIEIDEVENLANKIIYENREVKLYYPDEELMAKIPLRKKPPEGKKIRIVEVDNFDYSACGGTHCRFTGEVGIIKIMRWEKYKGNVRVEFQCGVRALRDYQCKNRTVSRMVDLLSVQESELVSKAEKILDDTKKMRKKCTGYLDELQECEARDLVRDAEWINDMKVIKKIFVDRDVNEVKNLAIKLKNIDQCVSLFGIESGKGHIIFSASENSEINAGELLKEVCEEVEGRGGGGTFFAQGGCNVNDVTTAIELAENLIKKNN